MSAKQAQPRVPRRKPKVRSPGDSAEGPGASVVLNRRTPHGSPLRLGALSWGVGDCWQQSPDEFLASLTGTDLRTCDLAVAAGLTLASPPQPRAVLDASGGTPVLFEVAAEGGDRSWLLAHRGHSSPQAVVLRRRQLVERFDDHEGFGRLAEAVAAGAGVISFEGTDLRLVLFICGENNLPAPDAARSVLKRMPGDPGRADRLTNLLAGPWLMLNPAHAPYYPPIRSTGFAKVGVVRFDGGQAGPTLRRLAEHEGRYRDGTAGPVAVVHVNNFDPRHPTTEEYAAVAFGDTPARVSRPTAPAGGEVAAPPQVARRWRACVFEVGTTAGGG